MNEKNLILLLLLLPFCTLCFTGCAWIDEIGKDKSYATVELKSTESELDSDLQCVADALPVEFWDFDSDEPSDGLTRLRFFESISDTLRGNYMEIRFIERDSKTLEICPEASEYAGTTFELTRSGCVQATLQVNSCSPKISVQLIGEMTLNDFSVERGGWVSGTFEGKFVYYNQVSSSTEVIETTVDIAAVSGKFAYVNHAGAVWNR